MEGSSNLRRIMDFTGRGIVRALALAVVLLRGSAAMGAVQTAVKLDSGGPLLSEQGAYDVQHCALDIEILPKRTWLRGTMTLEVRSVSPMSWFVLDLDTPLRVKHVRQQVTDAQSTSRALPFERRGGRIWIPLGKVEQPGQNLVFTVAYEGHPRRAVRPPWDGGFTWSKTKSGHPWIATSAQTQGADLWYPCKDHPSDKAESFTIRARVPEPLVVASNGRLVEVIEHPNKTRTYHWHTSIPTSFYNIALNIAPYRTIESQFKSVGGETVPVTYWVLPENEEKGKKLVPEMIEHLQFYERLLGPYLCRSEKYGVAETPHLGMEHQGIIAYGNAYRGGPHGYDWLHHHELGHEWWGNLITAIDWRHFWIHEGFCTYMQALYAEQREGAMAYHHALYTSRRKIRNKHPLVPPGPTGMLGMDKMASGDVYDKGSWILHTLRYLIGDKAFFQCLRRMAYPDAEWEQRKEGRATRFVSSEEFNALVNRVTGKSYDWLFKVYLHQAELPKLVPKTESDELILEWITPEKLPFPMPVEVKVGETTERVELPGGSVRLNAARYRDAKLDPNMWILKHER